MCLIFHKNCSNLLQKIREIPPDIESLLAKFCQKPLKALQKTDWNIPENVLNPVYEPQPGDEHFYSSELLVPCLNLITSIFTEI